MQTKLRCKALVISPPSGCWADVEGCGLVGLAQAQGYADYWQERADRLLTSTQQDRWEEAVANADFWADMVRNIKHANMGG